VGFEIRLTGEFIAEVTAPSPNMRMPPTHAETTHVIGCNHGIQKTTEEDLLPIDDIAEIRTQRLHFSRLLEALVASAKIEFIGEEWGLPQPSAAQVLSNQKGIPWANINTTLEDLNRMGIPRDYVHGHYDPAAKARWTELREEFMFRRIQENKGSAQHLMVVCGFRHLQPMARLLADLACTVQTTDYRALDWYRAGIFSNDE
jgi:hypothetical protein